MKVQLVVVRGKPEGKVIPLLGPTFKIGRGETCHLRPNSEQVSREHAEFTIGESSVHVRDLGSRNGTLVNGKALTDVYHLKDRDLVQVGPLTFAVSIAGAPAPAAPPKAVGAAPKAVAAGSGGGDEIDAWLVSEGGEPAAGAPSNVYGGDTITIKAFRDGSDTSAKPPSAASDDEYERQVDDENETVDHLAETADDLVMTDEDAAGTEVEAPDEEEEEEAEAEAEEEEEAEAAVDEFIDESNPFYIAKKAQKAAKAKESAGPAAKKSSMDSSDAAGDILRRLMERRRASRDE